MEQAATNKGVNINMPVTEENINKLRDNTTIASKTVQKTIINPADFGFAQNYSVFLYIRKPPLTTVCQHVQQ
jgi:hypothetical protein